jgi:uncharacterized membrane protein
MSKTVVAVFSKETAAREAVENLRQAGFDREISLLARNNDGKQNQQRQDNMGGLTASTDPGDTGIGDGVGTGGALGGLAGLAAGAGALVIPGIGPLIAAGPIAGLLSGAAAGGLAGGLLDLGIPEAESRQYENDVRQGKILVSVQTADNRADQANRILKEQGSDRVRIH